MLLKAAELGHCLAQTTVAVGSPEELAALERAAAQGEPIAMTNLGMALWWGHSGAAVDKPRGKRLLREAALLGNANAQYDLATNCCAANSLEAFQWLRRSALQRREQRAVIWLFDDLVYDEGGSGRILFEIGASLRAQMDGGVTHSSGPGHLLGASG